MLVLGQRRHAQESSRRAEGCRTCGHRSAHGTGVRRCYSASKTTYLPLNALVLELFSGVWISFDCVTAVVVSFVVDLASGRYGIQKSVCDRLTQNIHKNTHLYKRDSKMTRQRDAAINAERRPLESALPDHHIAHIDPAAKQTYTGST